MATAQTLLTQANCFACYRGQRHALRAQMLADIITGITPGTDVSPAAIAKLSNCFVCYGNHELLKVGLLLTIAGIVDPTGASSPSQPDACLISCPNDSGQQALVELAQLAALGAIKAPGVDFTPAAVLARASGVYSTGDYLLEEGLLAQLALVLSPAANVTPGALATLAQCSECYGSLMAQELGIWNRILAASASPAPAPPATAPVLSQTGPASESWVWAGANPDVWAFETSPSADGPWTDSGNGNEGFARDGSHTFDTGVWVHVIGRTGGGDAVTDASNAVHWT